MTDIERWTERRSNIAAAVKAAGITQVAYTRSYVPEDLSSGWQAAIISLKSEELGNETLVRGLRRKVQFEVFFVVDGEQADPDAVLFGLIEAFRASYIESEKDDIVSVEYWDSRAGAHSARIAKCLTARRMI